MPEDRKGGIAETFLKMVRRDGLDNVTVKALIEACHISRQTFYYHFQNLMDVLEWAVRQTTRRLVEQSLEAEDMRATLRAFVAYAVEAFPLLRKLLDSQRRAQVERLMIDAVEAYLRELVRRRRRDRSRLWAEPELLIRYTACGLVGVLLDWGGDAELDQERLTGQLEQILSRQLSGQAPAE